MDSELVNYFNSNDVEDLLRFYASFQSLDQIADWLKALPKPRPRIHHERGDVESDIAVIIPTPDVENNFSKNCKTNVFSGLDIYFSVDSSPSFNLAHSYNTVSKSFKTNKEVNWIIFSNVDMFQIDPPGKLISELKSLDPESETFAYARSRGSHNISWRIGPDSVAGGLMSHLSKNITLLRKLRRRLNIIYNIEEEKNHTFMPHAVKGKYSVRNGGDFYIFSSVLLKRFNYVPFDEVYLNGLEDIDLSIRLNENTRPEDFRQLNYDIGSFPAGIRGRDNVRFIRDLANLAYFNFKINNKLLILK